MTLCQTFRRLAFNTWEMLDQGRGVSYQIGEETLTDLNVLALKLKHPYEIQTQTFTKPEERNRGADWEWWFTGRSGDWFGIRVQAKVIDFETNTFRHLHYKPRGGREYQSDILIESSLCGDPSEPKPVPMYCLYSHWLSDHTTSLIDEATEEMMGRTAVGPVSLDDFGALPGAAGLALQRGDGTYQRFEHDGCHARWPPSVGCSAELLGHRCKDDACCPLCGGRSG